MLGRALKVRVGRESTAGTTATNMLDLIVEGEQLPLGELGYEMLPNERSSPLQRDNAAMVRGLKRRSPVKLAMVAKYPPSQLGAAATAPGAIDSASALSQELVLEHWLGARVAGRGSTVVSSADVRTVTVTTGHGTRFTVGMVVPVQVAGVYHLREITAIATDALSLFPDLPGSPATGQLVLGGRTYYRPESQTHTLTIEAANTESGTPTAQQRARMVRGQCAWTAEIGARAMLAFDGVAQDHDGPDDLGLTSTVVDDDMGADVLWAGVEGGAAASFIFPTADASNPTHTCLESIAVTAPNGWREQLCMSGVNGAAGVLNTGGRTADTLELSATWDSAGVSLVNAFAAGTVFTFLSYATRGSGTSQAWAGWYARRMAFDAQPSRVVKDGEVLVVCKFRCLANVDGTTEASRSPLSYFIC